MSRLDAVFVIPGNLTQVYQVFAKEHAIEPPIFALWIASHLESRGYSFEFIDAVPSNLSPEEVATEVVHLNPRLVIVPVYGSQPSASTQNMPSARITCQAIKDLAPDQKILITGTHPAALPERTLKEEPVDFVCDGEGPTTLIEIIEALRNGDDVSNVGSLWYWESGKPKYTHPARNVTELEFDPDIWRFLPMDRYIAHDWHTGYRDFASRKPYASILTTLGCPFRCSFCCIQTPFRAGEAAIGRNPKSNSYRFWSPQVIIKTIEVLVRKYGMEHIKIHDELFVLNQRHVSAICALIKERFNDDLNIWAYSRADTTQPKSLDILRAAGIRWLAVGIERDGKNKSFSGEDIIRVREMIKDAGIKLAANYIFGLPGDTKESMQATLDMALEVNSPFANFYCAMAYPGSELYKEAVKRNLPLPDSPGGPGWIGYSQHAYEAMPLPTDSLSAADILRFRDEAWRRYYTNPKFLSMFRDWYGENGEEAEKNIRKMTSLPPLRRALFEV